MITNQVSHVLSNKEYSILMFGLNGLATHPNEINILTYAEEIWEKIDKIDVCCNKVYSKSKIKKTLTGLVFNMINFEHARLLRD